MWQAHSIVQALHETARFFIVRGGEVEVALPLGGDAEREQGPGLSEGIAVRPCRARPSSLSAVDRVKSPRT